MPNLTIGFLSFWLTELTTGSNLPRMVPIYAHRPNIIIKNALFTFRRAPYCLLGGWLSDRLGRHSKKRLNIDEDSGHQYFFPLLSVWISNILHFKIENKSHWFFIVKAVFYWKYEKMLNWVTAWHSKSTVTYLLKRKIYVQKFIHNSTWFVKETLFTTAQKWKQATGLLTGKQITKCYISMQWNIFFSKRKEWSIDWYVLQHGINVKTSNIINKR